MTEHEREPQARILMFWAKKTEAVWERELWAKPGLGLALLPNWGVALEKSVGIPEPLCPHLQPGGWRQRADRGAMESEWLTSPFMTDSRIQHNIWKQLYFQKKGKSKEKKKYSGDSWRYLSAFFYLLISFLT